MKIGKIMKIDRIVWVTIIIGLGIVLICWWLAVCVLDSSLWDVFCEAETILGFIANLTIVAAALRYISYKTLDIGGIGKIKIGREHDNIQDLTNLVSSKFYGGKNFHRTPVLEAFYGKDSIEVMSVDPAYEQNREDAESMVKIEVEGKTFSVKRAEVKTIDNLINAVKVIYFDGNAPDEATLKEIYRKWYRVE